MTHSSNTSATFLMFQWISPFPPPPGRPDIENNDIQYNDTQHNGLICDTQHKATQHNDSQSNISYYEVPLP